jgi:hypothetical protein
MSEIKSIREILEELAAGDDRLRERTIDAEMQQYRMSAPDSIASEGFA